MNAPVPSLAVLAAADVAEALPRLVQPLKGGIGNQLFQIAFARQFARLTGVAAAEVAFDLAAFGSDPYGRHSVLHRLLPEGLVHGVRELPPEATRVIREQDLPLPPQGPLPARMGLPGDIRHFVLDGYWQDRRFVAEADRALFSERLQALLPPAAQAWAERLRLPTAVAVHIRRHDYAHHGLASESYYVDAMRWLAARGEREVFVFSDEPNYSRHFLAAASIQGHVVDSGDDLADLALMSLASAHVLSNSTFSWWGAVLADSKDVICPGPWSLVHQPAPELLPPHWRLVPDAVDRPAPAGRYPQRLEQEQFRVDREAFFAQAPLPEGWRVQLRPCLGDATATTGFDAHYTYHTAWAARRLLAHPVPQHTDIGSDIRFITMASAFQPIRFLDYRPAELMLSNIECGRANLLELDLPERSVNSLSCMHVVEHIGLGRYGDPINFHGADIAMAALQRVLAPGGLLYFVVPVGIPTIVFNAHRIFKASDIAKTFGELELLEFSLVRDDGRFLEHAQLSDADDQQYACGCFLLRRPA